MEKFSKNKLAKICMLFLVFCSASAQNQPTRCDTACANDNSCRNNICVLTRCSDTGIFYVCFFLFAYWIKI